MIPEVKDLESDGGEFTGYTRLLKP